MNNQTVGNSSLEAEYVASLILKEGLMAPTYGSLRVYLAQLPFAQVSPEFTALLMELQKKIIDKEGYLKDVQVDSYYYGKNDDLHEILLKLQSETIKTLPMYEAAIPQQFEDAYNALLEKQLSTPETYADYNENIDSITSQSDTINQLEEILYDLRKLEVLLQYIIQMYEFKPSKMIKQKLNPQVSPAYFIYLSGLITDLDQYTDSMEISMVVGTCVDTLLSMYPQDNLDPYLKDVCANMVEVLINPKDFYSMCQNDQILSSSVGQMFAHCYKEFYMQFLDMYMDGYENMTYQEQIDFRKCFALDSDDSELTSLCSRYVQLGFSQQ